MEKDKAPATYAEWLKLFRRLQDGNFTEEDLNAVQYGTFIADGIIFDKFENNTVDTVNRMTNRIIGQFTKEVTLCLEENDYSMMQSMISRFIRNISCCRFYLDLRMLPGDFLEELDNSFQHEVKRYLKELCRSLQNAEEETSVSELEDFIYELKHIDIGWKTVQTIL